jgi:hypothetical protein
MVLFAPGLVAACPDSLRCFKSGASPIEQGRLIVRENPHVVIGPPVGPNLPNFTNVQQNAAMPILPEVTVAPYSSAFYNFRLHAAPATGATNPFVFFSLFARWRYLEWSGCPKHGESSAPAPCVFSPW